MVMLATALAFGHLARKLKQPVVIGELIGGIVIGPTIFGMLAPGLHAQLFPTSGDVKVGREAIINLGMLFFLFVSGLEINTVLLRKVKGGTVIVSALGILAPFTFGFLAVVFSPNFWGAPATANPMLFALFMGTAMSITALPVIARILVDLNLLGKRMGVLIISSAMIDDIIGWSLFAVIVSAFVPGAITGNDPVISIFLVLTFFVFMLVLGRWAGQKVLHWVQANMPLPSVRLGLMAVWMLVAAGIAEAIGIHAFFGAFLAGVALAQNKEKRKPAHESIYHFAIGFLAPIYFVSIGLRTDFSANFDLALFSIILFVACVGKFAGAGLGARIAGLNFRESVAVGAGMNARGAMEIILATMALEFGIIDQRIYVALVLMAMITSLISGTIIRRMIPHKPPGEAPEPEEEEPDVDMGPS